MLDVNGVNPSDSSRAPVERFRLAVVGGTFTVTEVMLTPGQSAAQAVEAILGEPAERWLVMAAAEQGAGADSLALINDAYECQIVALGSLQPEP
jgi:hypothetical protein